MATAQEALKAKLMGNAVAPQEVPTVPAQGEVSPVQDIVDVKKGYAGEEDVDLLAATSMIHQEALQMLAKEVISLKQLIVDIVRAKSSKNASK